MIEKYTNEHLGETLHYKKAASGLDMYVVQKKDFTKTFAYYATAYGGNDSEFLHRGVHIEMPQGMAHFLEHKLFESKEKSIFKRFNQRGASVNAYTNAKATVYYFSATESFEENLKDLMDFVQVLEITEDDVEKEKGIIQEEIAMYLDQADWRLYQSTLEALYRVFPMRHSIAGNYRSLLRIEKSDLDYCYKTFYTPRNSFVLVVGDVPIRETFDLIEATQTVEFINRPFEVERLSYPEPISVNTERVDIPFNVSQVKSFIGFKDSVEGIKGKSLYRRSLVSKLMNELFFGRASVIYNRLYQSGQINTTFGIDYLYDQGYGFTLIGGDGHDPEAVHAAILAFGLEVDDDQDALLDDLESQFERVKRKAMGRYLMSFNGLEFIGHQYVSHILKGINPMDYLDTMEGIRVEEVIERFKSHLIKQTPCIVTLSPLNNKFDTQ
jgi:predicted Zn-dependent peptidase